MNLYKLEYNVFYCIPSGSMRLYVFHFVIVSYLLLCYESCIESCYESCIESCYESCIESCYESE